jgi:hypothetical protein
MRLALDVRWPNRDRKTDGWIGDAAHQATKSDHNPNERGSVNARDIDKDGIIPAVVVAAAILCPSVNYVIWNRRIMDRDVQSWRPREYTGSNPHTGHLHVSIYQSLGAETHPHDWRELLVAPTWGWQLRRNERVAYVEHRQLQAILDGWGYALRVDGLFGKATDDAVRRFQVAARVPNSVRNGQGDGIVGPQTRAALWGVPV